MRVRLDSETKKNIQKLIEIRDDPETAPAVRIQAIQTMQKIMDTVGAIKADKAAPTEADIMKKIRSAKK